jgi:Ca-activated chloride channel family protein
MMTQPAPALLRDVRGNPVPLQAARAEVHVNDLLTCVTLEHTYENREGEPIEAVYSFPVPAEAVLHRLEVEFDGRTLHAVSVERTEAAQRYEETLEQRDAAVMLEQPEPGLYTLSFGNLPAGQAAKIRVVYAAAHRWVGDTLRICVPTVVALRYGHSPLPPHALPQTDLRVEYPFEFAVFVTGAIADTPFECHSHELTRRPGGGGMVLGLQDGRAFLDRDLVITFTRAAGAGEAVALLDDTPADSAPAADAPATARARHVAMCTFTPRCPGAPPRRPRCVKLIIDCSGSMMGESIAQARNALGLVLTQLDAEDSFTILRFGSHVDAMHARPVMATGENVMAARRAVRNMQADLGGTEILGALVAAFKCRGPVGHSEEILLITDGAVGNWEGVVRQWAMEAGQRIFSVGVGNAPAAPFLQALAAAGGGGRAEFVTPGEEMRDVIVRQFQRMSLPRVKSLEVEWPRSPSCQVGVDDARVYAGDTATVYAWFDGAEPDGAADGGAREGAYEGPHGGPLQGTHERAGDGGTGTGARLVHAAPREEVNVCVRWEHGETTHHSAMLSPSRDVLDSGIVAKLAARERIEVTADDAEAVALAVRHGLASRGTHLLLTAALEAGQGSEMPASRHVAQMHAAGWGGIGDGLAELEVLDDTMDFCASVPAYHESDVLDLELGATEDGTTPRPAARSRSPQPSADFFEACFSDALSSQFGAGQARVGAPDGVTGMSSHLETREIFDATGAYSKSGWLGSMGRRLARRLTREDEVSAWLLGMGPGEQGARATQVHASVELHDLLTALCVPTTLVNQLIALAEEGRFSGAEVKLALVVAVVRLGTNTAVSLPQGIRLNEAAVSAVESLLSAA